jgi:hypothetical protein
VRQVAPWRPRSQDPENTIADATAIHWWHATRLVWQHWLNGRPLIVREFLAHDSAPSQGLESGLGCQAQRISKGTFGRYAAESRPIMLKLSFPADELPAD